MTTNIFNFQIIYKLNYGNLRYLHILLYKYVGFKYFFALFSTIIKEDKYFIYYFSNYLQLSDGECDFIEME